MKKASVAGYMLFLFATMFLAASYALAEDSIKSPEPDTTIVNEMMEKAKEAAKSMSKPQSIYQKQGEQEAQKVMDTYNSEEFQKKVAEFSEKLQKDLAPVSVKEYYKDAAKKAAGFRLAGNERLYIFISTSVPVGTIREYVKDAVALGSMNIAFVLRGGAGGMTALAPTAKFISQCTLRDADCYLHSGKCKAYNVAFEIDPLLYRKYAVDAVPAIVYVPSMTVADRNVSEGREGNVTSGEFYAVYGDVSLAFALEQIAKETKSVHVTNMVKALYKDSSGN